MFIFCLKLFLLIRLNQGNGLFYLLAVIRAAGIEILDTVCVVSVVAEQGLDMVHLGKVAGLAFAHNEIASAEVFGLDGL